MTLVDPLPSVVHCKNFISGEFTDSNSSQSINVISPYTGTLIGTVPVSNSTDIATCVDLAQKAFEPWRKTSIKERTQYLFRFRELVLRDLERLSNTTALESGKTVAEAKAGIMKGLEVVEFALSLQNSSAGEMMQVSRGITCSSSREPLGVVLGITPFNFPAMVPFWMYPIAITLGNCFILKPSEKVPLTSQHIAKLIQEAGFPAGVFSIVNGDKSSVEHLISQPIQAVAFVGSTAAAHNVYAKATQRGQRALCLGGAKNSLILVPDADPAITIDGVVSSFTGCAGQRCMAASLLLAVGNVESLLSAIIERAKVLTPGDCLGAIIDKASHKRICDAISSAEQEGAKIVLDGRKVSPPKGYENGNWLGPTIIDYASQSMDCATEELFGPVLTIVRVQSLSAALHIEAQSRYGNATSIFTSNGSIARQVAEQASAGMIGINIGVPVPREPFSFGGTKASKFGSCDITGYSSVEFWTSLKKVTSKWEALGKGSAASWMS